MTAPRLATVPESLPEHKLAPINPNWLKLTGHIHQVDFRGSCHLFSYSLHVHLYALDDDTANVAATLTIRDPAPHLSAHSYSPTQQLYRCQLRMDAYRNATIRECDWTSACILDGIAPGATYLLGFSKILQRSDPIYVTHAYLQFTPVSVSACGSVHQQTGAPTALALRGSYLDTFNDANLCDCSILAKDTADPIHVSRAILAHGSPFFRTMFTGGWAESTSGSGPSGGGTPIALGWTVAAILPCLVHMYCGWVTGQPLPDDAAVVHELCAKFAMDFGALTAHQLMEVADLARLLELKALVKAATQEMVRVLNAQLVEMDSASDCQL